MTTVVNSGLESDDAAHADASLYPDETELLRRRRLAVGGMTCGICVRHVEGALRSVPGVVGASVDLRTATADINYDLTRVSLSALQAAVTAVGYTLNGIAATDTSIIALPPPGRRIPWWPLLAGLLAGALLSSLYIAIVGLAQGMDHAVELLVSDWYFVIPIVVGFGLQVALLVYVRTRLRLHATGSSKALAGAATGTSTVSMVACCAHHVTDLLPILGISGAALFLNEYRGPLMVIGISGNAVGIVLMVRLIRRFRTLSCRIDDRSPSGMPASTAAQVSAPGELSN